jgi:transglutaminase-like putative cysteine protease
MNSTAGGTGSVRGPGATGDPAGASAGGQSMGQEQTSTQGARRAAVSGRGAGTDSAEFLVEHDTEYTYSTQVAFAQHLAHLTPLVAAGQGVRDFEMTIDPPPAIRHGGTDTYGNERTYFAISVAHEGLRVQTRSRVRLQPRFAHIDPHGSPPWESVRDALRYVAGAPLVAAAEFVFSSAFVPYDTALRDYALLSFPPGRTLLAGALDLMHRIHADFRYDANSTDVATPVQEAFAARAGVCQDFTHVMIGGLRALGLPARYVSGYLFTQARFAPARPGAPDATPAAPPVIGADASHAWVSVYCPKYGWVDLDPTNDAVPGTGHVRLATGRDYGDVAPLRGVVQGGGEHHLRVAVRLTAIAA